jgi:hypothetical protein
MSSAAIAVEIGPCGACWEIPEVAASAEEAEQSSIRAEISRVHLEIATTDPV